MTWLVWAIPLIITIFLWNLNEFLRGTLKRYINAGLALLIFVILGVAFFVSGWIIGLITVVGVAVLLAVLHYPALLVAKKITKYPDPGVENYWEKEFKEMQRDWSYLGTPEFDERIGKREQEETRHMIDTINKAMSKGDIQKVLERLSCSKRDLEAFYQRFEIHSLPPKLRERTLCNARLLNYFLENSVPGEAIGRYVRNIIDRNAVIRFTLWARYNPDCDEPK